MFRLELSSLSFLLIFLQVSVKLTMEINAGTELSISNAVNITTNLGTLTGTKSKRPVGGIMKHLKLQINHGGTKTDRNKKANWIKASVNRDLVGGLNISKTGVTFATRGIHTAFTSAEMQLDMTNRYANKPQWPRVSRRGYLRYSGQKHTDDSFVVRRRTRSLQSSQYGADSATENTQEVQLHVAFQTSKTMSTQQRDLRTGESVFKLNYNKTYPGDITTLADVYEFLNDMLRSAAPNDTEGNDFPNMTIDANALCLETMGRYFMSIGNINNDDGQVYCDSAWYGVSCWPRTIANTTVNIPCPAHLAGINAANNASKFCNSNGTWADRADYTQCVVTGHTQAPKATDNVPTRMIYNVGFAVSTVALVIALFIFLYFRSLRCLRNAIHSHLIVSFIIKYVLWMIMNHTYLDLHHDDYSWICKALTTLFNFANATNFFWMFVEGLYLHIIIVWTYSADKIKLRYLIFIGWVLPAINVVPWIVVRQELENTVCWLPRTDVISLYDFILYGPIFFVLFANIVFLSTIVWVLITKLRASHTLEIRQYRKAVKATVILFPLLGITYVLFIIPPSNHHRVQTVFEYINAVLQSFQGLLVAVFYCFLNGEVKSVIKKKLSRYNDARALSTKFTRASYGGWTRSSDFGHSISHGNATTCVIYVDNKLNGSDSNRAEDIPLQACTNGNSG